MMAHHGYVVILDEQVTEDAAERLAASLAAMPEVISITPAQLTPQERAHAYALQAHEAAKQAHEAAAHVRLAARFAREVARNRRMRILHPTRRAAAAWALRSAYRRLSNRVVLAALWVRYRW